MPFQPLLHDIGLSDYEGRIYEALMRQSPASASWIAKTCGLSRSSVYTTLQTLIGKGLVGTTYRNEVKQFVAQDFSAFERGITATREQLEHQMRALEQLKQTWSVMGGETAHLPNIVFFEGQEGLKRIYLSMMRNAEQGSTMSILRDEFVWKPEWAFVFEEEWHARVRRLKMEKDIRTRLIVNTSATERAHLTHYTQKKGLEYRFLPVSHAVHDFALYIVNDVLSLMSFEKNHLVGIQMTNAVLARNMQLMFEGAWKMSSKKN